jgi:hypothetical protein
MTKRTFRRAEPTPWRKHCISASVTTQANSKLTQTSALEQTKRASSKSPRPKRDQQACCSVFAAAHPDELQVAVTSPIHGHVHVDIQLCGHTGHTWPAQSPGIACSIFPVSCGNERTISCEWREIFLVMREEKSPHEILFRCVSAIWVLDSTPAVWSALACVYVCNYVSGAGTTTLSLTCVVSPIRFFLCSLMRLRWTFQVQPAVTSDSIATETHSFTRLHATDFSAALVFFLSVCLSRFYVCMISSNMHARHKTWQGMPCHVTKYRYSFATHELVSIHVQCTTIQDESTKTTLVFSKGPV